MPAGRPRSGGKETFPELAELTEWFRQALAAAGYSNIRKFLQRHPFEKNATYEVMSGARFIPLERAQQLAAALGRDPLEVEPVWLRAKQRMELARRRKSPDQALASWADIEQPEPSVRHLLVAQTQASELLPYGLPGLRAPLLSTIYVRQLLRDRRLASGGSDAGVPRPVEGSAGDDVLLADDVLSRHDHLLITGEPGTGKSVFCREVTRRLARIWLREDAADAPPVEHPVVPLVVQARALAAQGPFSSVLAAAVRDVYGIAMLTELQPGQFADLIHGARWLLFVDGLDEIVDQALRTRIIRAIAGHAKAGAPYKFVVTTRPLADLQLAPLREGHWAAYSLEPFGHAELRLFASRWFAAQKSSADDDMAESFLREIGDIRLRNVVSNPLLATIAAATKTLEPDGALPLSRIDLYGRFCRCLIDEEISGRAGCHQTRLQAGGERYRIAEWLFSQRREMLTHLAESYLQGEPSLLAVAAEWIRQRLPDDFATTVVPRDDLRDMLVDTGFFVAEGSDLRFFHQSLAEYLAAAATAERLPSVIPDLGAWVKRSHDPAQRTFVIFTLLLWGRVNESLDLLMRDLMDGPPEFLLLAGRILGDCGGSKPGLAGEIVERMLDLGLGAASIIYQDNFDRDRGYRVGIQEDDAIVHPGQVFLILSRMFGDPFVASRLRRIASSGELATQTRIFAAHALGFVADSEEAIRILLSLTDEVSAAAELVDVVKATLSLDPKATHLVEPILRRITMTKAESSVVVDAAQLMLRIGQPQLAVEAAWSIVRGPTTAAWCVRKAVQIILDHRGEASLEGLIAVANGLLGTSSPTVRWILIGLAESPMRDAVAGFCRKALADPATHSWQLPMIAGGWVNAAGAGVVTEVGDLLQVRGANFSAVSGEVALRLFETGYYDQAFQVAIRVAEDESRGYPDYTAAWICVSVADHSQLPAALEVIDRLPKRGTEECQRIMRRLAEVGETNRAKEWARAIAKDLHADRSAVQEALNILLLDTDPLTLAQEIDQVSEQGKLASHKVAAAELAMELGACERATAIVRSFFNESNTVLGDKAGRMARILIQCEGLKTSKEVLTFIQEIPEHSRSERVLIEAASQLSLAGALPVATSLWQELLTDLSVSIAASFQASSAIVQSGQRDLALSTLRTALSQDGISAANRARLAALLAWVLARDPT